jgi:hypothetical protein
MIAAREAARAVDPRERAAASKAETLAIIDRLDGPRRQRAEAIAAALSGRGDCSISDVLDSVYGARTPKPQAVVPVMQWSDYRAAIEARDTPPPIRKGRPMSPEQRAKIGAAVRLRLAQN